MPRPPVGLLADILTDQDKYHTYDQVYQRADQQFLPVDRLFSYSFSYSRRPLLSSALHLFVLSIFYVLIIDLLG